jgi:MurNAc alpha-1-phosphate uridylyltransferase
MKAMILAAGRGARMGELTASTPKPLLTVGGITLLENKIRLLADAGITDIVINVAYCGEQIQAFAGDGSRWQVSIQYSVEKEPLETGGGIAHALPLLGDKTFLAINADIWCDFSLRQLSQQALASSVLGHLVMVDNPAQHQSGDFGISKNGFIVVGNSDNKKFTFSGIAFYHPDLIANYPRKRERFPLLEVFHYAIEKKQLSGEYYAGLWNDVGTPQRLKQLNESA